MPLGDFGQETYDRGSEMGRKSIMEPAERHQTRSRAMAPGVFGPNHGSVPVPLL